MTIKIRTVNEHPHVEDVVRKNSSVTIPTLTTNVHNYGGKVTVQGIGLSNGVAVCCTLTRLQRKPSQGPPPKEAIRTITRFGRRYRDDQQKRDDNWRVTFEGVENARYILACHARPDADGTHQDADPAQNLYLELEVTGASVYATIVRAHFRTDSIGVDSGTVLFANNLVTCTLTPINSDGTPILMAGFPMSQTITANQYSWAYSFSPPFPLTSFRAGQYQFESWAPFEGSDSTTGSV
jgi:hypothetical protein